MSPIFKVSFVLLLSCTLFLSAQGGANDGLFFIKPTAKTTADEKPSIEIENEAVLEDARKNLSEDEKSSLLTQKVDLYARIVDSLQIGRWNAAEDDIKTYFDVIKQIYGPKDYGFKEVMSEAYMLLGKNL